MQEEDSPGGKLGVQRAEVCIQRRFAGSVDCLSRSRHLQAAILFAAKAPNLQYPCCKDRLFYPLPYVSDGTKKAPHLRRGLL